MDADKKDIWDKLQVVGIPIAVLIVGTLVSVNQKTSENDVKFVEIATAVLREEPTDEKRALRLWAIDVLAAKSPVKLPPEVRDELIKRSAPIYSGGWDTSSGGSMAVVTRKSH